MSEVAKAVKPLFDKFIDFFHIFDLSFFVSGATFVAAIAWAGLTPDLARLFGFEPLDAGGFLITGQMPGVAAVMLVLASYVAGMTCFALGRFVRKWTFIIKDRITGKTEYNRDSLFEELWQHGVLERREGGGFALSEYGKRVPWLARYLVEGGKHRESALYVRMWAEVRQLERFAPSFSLLSRYWVSSATLDGLFVALGTWAVLLAMKDQTVHGWFPSVATVVGALFCLREAQRYGVYQREELVATLLHGYDLPDEGLGNMMERVPAAPVDETPAVTPARAPAPAPDDDSDAARE